MTLLSVVLPVYKVQGYLAECLDSLLGQSFTDVEVVAVDDRSPDHSGAILAEYATRDPRLKVVSLERNVGLGHARNAGLEHATGEYVWFVDSDDWLAPGALAAVAARLRETDADVLVAGWDRVYWDGRVSAGTGLKILAAAPETFTVEEFPRILTVLHVAWNKVVRRQLLLDSGLRFETGWYEDVSYTFPVLVGAQRITALAKVCVHYRQRRTGAITRTVGDRHFEVFDHWERTFSLVGDVSAAVRPLLFLRMMWHYLTVLRHGERLPRGSRRRFFDRMAQDYRAYLPPGGYPRPGGAEGLRHRAVARGSFAMYRGVGLAVRLVRAARALRRRPVRLARRVARRVRETLYRGYYRLQLRLPVDEDLAVYAAYWYRGVACNPAAVAAKAAELVPGVRTVWVVGRGRTAGLPPGTSYVVAGTLGHYRALARGRWLVNNVNWPNWVVKRPGTTHVMTHHGTPLKMMGLDQVAHPASIKDQDFAAQMRRADRWDFSVTSNAHTTVAWERAYPCGYETLEVGYPRNDRLATATPADVAAVRERLGLAPHERVVLYAPTHREWTPANHRVLDEAELAAELGEDTVLLVRAHYFTVPAGTTTGPRASRVLDVSGYPVVEDLYLAADVLVTDYSSAMFDYAVLDRPVVVFAPDWQAYTELRGVYFDLLSSPPGAVAQSFPDLLDVFRTGAYAGDQAAKARARFRERFCYLDDGGAAERVVRRVWAERLSG